MSTTVLDLLLDLPVCFNNSLHGKCLPLSLPDFILPADSTANAKQVKEPLPLLSQLLLSSKPDKT